MCVMRGVCSVKIYRGDSGDEISVQQGGRRFHPKFTAVLLGDEDAHESDLPPKTQGRALGDHERWVAKYDAAE